MGFLSLSSLIYSSVVFPWLHSTTAESSESHGDNFQAGSGSYEEGWLFALFSHVRELWDNTSTFLLLNYTKTSNMSPWEPCLAIGFKCSFQKFQLSSQS